MLSSTFQEERELFLDTIQLAAADCVHEAEVILGIYRALTPTEQQWVPLDDLVAAAGVSAPEVMGILAKAATAHGLKMADWRAAIMHPRIVQRATKSALRIGGPHADIAQKDRVILLQKQSFAPVPRGTTVTVNAHASANAKAAAAAASQPSVPSFLDDVGSLQGPKDAVQRALIGSTEDP